MDTKERLLNEILCCFSQFDSGNMEQLRDKMIIVLSPYSIRIEDMSLSTEVKTEDVKAYQMYFISKKIEGLSERTLQVYKYIVDEFLGFVKKSLNDITTNDIRYYLAYSQEQTKCTNSYNDTKRRYLNSFFSWLETEGYVSKNPVKCIKKIKYEKRVKLPFEPAEVERLRDAVKIYADKARLKESNKILLYKRNLAIIEVLLSTGMRVGELAKLKSNHLNLADGTVKVMGKGAKERLCYLNDVSKMRLTDYLNCRGYESEWVFTNIANKGTSTKEKTPVTISSVEKFVRELGEITDIKEVHPHRFRRTAATWCIRRGMEIEKVRQMLGHEKIETTLIYAITSADDVRAGHKKYMN